MMKRAFALVALLGAVACGSEAGAPDGTPPPPEAKNGAPPPVATSTSAPPPAATTPPEKEKLGAPYPIVLMHGMGGFGKLTVGPINVTYFDGVVEDLAKNGEQVFVTIVPAYDTSEERSKALAAQIDTILARTGKAKVNLIGHSQGGMDARLIASPKGLNYGDRIASVTTIATPHRGSKVADAVMKLVDGLPASVVDDVTGAFLGVLEKTAYELKQDPHLRAQVTELSEKYMTTVFNPKYTDAPGVTYMSYAGRTNLKNGKGVCDDGHYPNDPFALDATQIMLAPLAIFLEEGKGKVNDGLVTVESSKWGEFQQCVPADHLKEVGQLGPSAITFDHLAFFRTVVLRLRQNGF